MSFYNNVSAKDRLQDINFNDLKLKVKDTFKKDEKKTTKIESSNDEVVINKAYLDRLYFEIEGHTSFEEKNLKRI